MRCNYNLSYFNLWWKRMLREGEREEAIRRKEMLRRKLKMKRKTTLVSEVDKNNEKEFTNQLQINIEEMIIGGTEYTQLCK